MTDTFDVEASREELRNLEQAHIADNEQVKSLITGLNSKVTTAKFNGLEFRIHASIPRHVKKLALEFKQSQDAFQEGEISFEELYEPLYQILANLCIDVPWNNPDTWRHIENETGSADKMMEAFFDEINGIQSKIKKFRPT